MSTLFRIKVKANPPLVREWTAKDKIDAQRKMRRYLSYYYPHLQTRQIEVFAMRNK